MGDKFSTMKENDVVLLPEFFQDISGGKRYMIS